MMKIAEIQHIREVFSDEHRKKLIKASKPYVRLSTKQPGLWRTDDLRLHEDFKDSCNHLVKSFERLIGKKLDLMNAWITYSRGKLLSYHDHPFDYACVYYMKTNPLLKNNGTMFKLISGEEKLIETPQNGAILFPGRMLHAAPSFFFPVTRYTLSMDMNVL